MVNDETKGVRESGRRLAAIMFTDMVGFSSLTEQDEAGALKLLDIQTRLMEPILVVHGGRLVRTMGDGTFVEFGSAVSACKAALEIQDAVAKHNETGPRFQIRIGVHLGDIEVVDGDLLGHGVNVAARIEPLADPGGVCVSEDVARQVTGKIGAELVSIGTPKLKGIEGGVKVFKLVRARYEKPIEASSSQRRMQSIAVLPFANLSPDPENEYFGDGLTEEILWALSKVRTLAVVSRTSCFALKGTTKPIKEVGKFLGVDHVLEGSVRKAGNRIRITVQLVDIAKDRAIYTDKFDRELEDIFAIQEEITQSVVDALQIAVSEAEQGAISRIPTRNIKAYEAYIKAVTTAWVMPYESPPYFEEAIRLDPDFAKAHAAYALNLMILLRFMSGSDMSPLEKARSAAKRALELQPDLAEAHAAVAEVAFQDGDTKTAIAEYEAALNLDPNSYEVLYSYGRMLMVVHDYPNALKVMRRASLVRPDEYQPYVMATQLVEELEGEESHLEQLKEAIKRIEGRLRCCPSESRAYVLGSLLYLKLGNREKGREYVQRAMQLDPTSGTYYNAACFHSLDGDYEKAIETLEKAYELGINFSAWTKEDPDFKPIINDPRVQAILAKMDTRMIAKGES